MSVIELRRHHDQGRPFVARALFLDVLSSAQMPDTPHTESLKLDDLRRLAMIDLRRKTALASAAVVAAVLLVAPMQSASAAQGCQTIAASPGVYTQTTVEYSNHWSISNSPTNHGYNWYLKHTNGAIEDSGYATGAIGTKVEPANDYYMQIYNSGGVLQSFYVCYAVV